MGCEAEVCKVKDEWDEAEVCKVKGEWDVRLRCAR